MQRYSSENNVNLLVVTREFPPYIVGGLGYYVGEICAALSQRGHDITVLAGKCGKTNRIDDIGTPDDVEVEWVPYPTMQAYHIQFPAVVYRRLNRMSLSEFDVLISHTQLPNSVDIPTINHFHDAKQKERWFRRRNQSPLYKVLDSALNPTRRWVSQRSIDHSDTLLFNSHLTKRTWAQYYDLGTDVEVVHNGVDTAVFEPNPDVDEDFLLFVGDSVRKGLPQVRAFAKHSRYPVYVVGQDIEESEGVRVFSNISRSKLVGLYSSAVVTIHPAEFEAFGNVILESLACGTPAVVSPTCGASEIIDDSCGCVSTDIESSVTAVKDIPPENCVSKAAEYSWESVAERTERILYETATKAGAVY